MNQNLNVVGNESISDDYIQPGQTLSAFMNKGKEYKK